MTTKDSLIFLLREEVAVLQERCQGLEDIISPPKMIPWSAEISHNGAMFKFGGEERSQGRCLSRVSGIVAQFLREENQLESHAAALGKG